MNARTILLWIMFVLLIIASMTAVTIAQEDDWTPPPPPALPSTGGGGSSGGGSSGGGSYSPPVFKPYTVNLSSSDNTGIGSVDVKDYSLATVKASKSLGEGNVTVDVGLNGDLGSMPSTLKLDILPVSVRNINIPLDLDIFSPLMAFNMTRYSSGGDWPMKDGTVHLTLKVPADMLAGLDLSSKFYLLKDDGTRFILYGVVPKIENGVALFDVLLYYETRSPSTSGTFTLAGTRARGAAVSTATPTPAPVQATPTPKATGSNASVLLLVAALGIAVIYLSRRKKH